MGTAIIGVVLGAIGVVLAVANAATTVAVWSSAMYGRGQKIAQTALVWLVPGAALLVWGLVRSFPPPRSSGWEGSDEAWNTWGPEERNVGGDVHHTGDHH